MGVFALGLYAVMINWLVRNRAFGYAAACRCTAVIGTVLCQIAFGLRGGTPSGLIQGFLAGYIIAITVALTHSRGALFKQLAQTRFARIWHAAIEFRSFAIVTAPSGLINALGSQAPSFVLPMLYGPEVTGQYALANRILSQPMVLVGQAANQVLWGNAARLKTEDPERLWPMFLRLNACLLALMAPGLVLTAFGPQIFGLVFGREWEDAGRFAGIMIVMFVLALPAHGTASLELYRLNHWMSAWEFTRLGLVAAGLGIAAWLSLSAIQCVMVLTGAFAAANALLLCLNGWAVRRANAGHNASVSQGAHADDVRT